MSIPARRMAWVQSLAARREHATKALAHVAVAAISATAVACSGSADAAHNATAASATGAPNATGTAATTPQTSVSAPMPPVAQKTFEPAWANVAVGSTCTVAPEGETDPASAVTVPVDEDGIAHFSAVRATSDTDVQRLTLACKGSDGAHSYSVDLRAGGVFIPPPAQTGQTEGAGQAVAAGQAGHAALTVRPAIQGDPMTFSPHELIHQGFGVRPDPARNPLGYARWAAATQRSLRKHLPLTAPMQLGSTLRAARPNNDRGHLAATTATALGTTATAAASTGFAQTRIAQTATGPMAASGESFPVVMPGPSSIPDGEPLSAPTPNSVYCDGMPPSCYWTGAVLSGSYAPSQQQGYALNEATFNVPALVPGGFDSGPTIMSIWTGLDNVWQAIVFVQASPTVASTWIQTQPHLTVAADSSPNAGANPTFVPNLNDTIYAQEWYCDAQGNVNLNGGYACSFIEDMQTGDGWSCVEADAPAGECASFKLDPSDTVGTQAEFIVENDSPQASVGSDLWPDFSLVTMTGSAEVLKNGTTFVGWTSPTTDSAVTVAEDWPPTDLSYVDQEIVNIEEDGSLHWQIAQPEPAIAIHASGETDVVYQDTDHSLVYVAAPAGSDWTATTIAPAGTTFSAPALVARTDGSDEVDVAVEGANHSLAFYSNKPGQAWAQSLIAPAGTVYSSPVMVVRASGEVDIAFEGVNNTLQYAYLPPGGNWQTVQIAGAGTAFSAPSMQVRDWSTQEVDVAVEGPSFSLSYYTGTPSSGWTTSQVEGTNTTYSAPSLYVWRDGSNRVDVAAQGAGQTLHDYFSTNGAWNDALVAGKSTTVGAPTLLVDGSGQATIVAEGVHNGLMFYTAPAGSSWSTTQVAGDLTTYGPGSMVVRPSGEIDIVAPGTGALPSYYVLSASATSSWAVASL